MDRPKLYLHLSCLTSLPTHTAVSPGPLSLSSTATYARDATLPMPTQLPVTGYVVELSCRILPAYNHDVLCPRTHRGTRSGVGGPPGAFGNRRRQFIVEEDSSAPCRWQFPGVVAAQNRPSSVHVTRGIQRQENKQSATARNERLTSHHCLECSC
ncbi:hypothetical protein EDD16DRAFT_422349 [Pisolithus croceorrhizus]|nr:hypothetical protein EDD16DRAFT_422349 [Pisolithus croceorrhizus]